MIINDPQSRMPAAYLKVFLQNAEAAHIALQPLLSGTKLSLDQLLQSDQPVDFADILQFLANARKTLGAGWHLSLGPQLTIPSHGPLGFAVVTAPDMRASVDVLLRFISLRAPFLWSAGAVEEDQYVIRFYETVDMGEQRGTMIELAALSAQGLLERPLGREIRGAKLSFAYSAPPYRNVMEQAYHADLTFNAPQHSLQFPATWLDEPCALFDQAMHRYLLARCEEELLTVAGSLPAEIAVRQALLLRPGVIPSLADIASSQHISPRTLIRRLKRGNSSYQAIVEDVRKTLSRDYLLNSTLSINRIAWRLGYQDPSNFSRAFRRWYGTSPQRFRERGQVCPLLN